MGKKNTKEMHTQTHKYTLKKNQSPLAEEQPTNFRLENHFLELDFIHLHVLVPKMYTQMKPGKGSLSSV